MADKMTRYLVLLNIRNHMEKIQWRRYQDEKRLKQKKI